MSCLSQRPKASPHDQKQNRMNHPLREYARTNFGKYIGTLAKNAEISLLNWSVQSARRQNRDASWENPLFRQIYKTKLGWLLAEFRRPNYAVTALLVPDASGYVHLQLHYDKENQLAWRLKHKELDVRQLAKYPADVLWPDGPWAKTMLAMRTKDLIREEAKAKMDADYVGMFKCRRCGKNKVTYTSAQTRSADEPMTNFFCCLSCGNRWKG